MLFTNFIYQLVKKHSLQSLKIQRGELALKKYFKLEIYNKPNLCNINNFFCLNYLEFQNA